MSCGPHGRRGSIRNQLYNCSSRCPVSMGLTLVLLGPCNGNSYFERRARDMLLSKRNGHAGVSCDAICTNYTVCPITTVLDVCNWIAGATE